MCSICITHFWCERNDAVIRSAHSTTPASVIRFWTTGVRHLFTLAMREHRGAETFVQRAQLHACIKRFTLEWSAEPLYLAGYHEQPPRPVLYSWLR